MPTTLKLPSKNEPVEELHSSPWSLQFLLRKSCEVTEAYGAVFMTQVNGGNPQFKGCHRVAKALAVRIVDEFKNEPFLPGKTACNVKIIGMSPVLCLSVGTLIHQSKKGICTHARLIVLLPATRQMSHHAVSLLQDILNDIAVALDYYQKQSAYFTRFAEQSGLKTCLICENLQYATDQWLRWDEFLMRQSGARLSHTICNACAGLHYTECTAAKNGTPHLSADQHSLFNSPDHGGCIDVCAICEHLRTEAGNWVRWDSYISRLGHVNYTHTLCHECCGNHKVEG